MSEEELPDMDYFLNKLTLMTILEKNLFTSFKSQTIYLSCPHIVMRRIIVPTYGNFTAD